MWIDALCIDQSTKSEQTQQVNLMKGIYRKAHEALMWVGKENQDIDLGLTFRVTRARYNYASQK